MTTPPSFDPRYARSAELYGQARLALPGGVSSSYRMGQLPFPLIWARGESAYLWDADGNRYIDHVLGNGSVILGHAHAAVVQAIRANLENGQLYGGQTEGEILLAHEIRQMVPCAEMVTYGLSGSDAVHTALRLSRAFTGRTKIVKFEGHYHGWFDNIAVSVIPIGGPPEAPAPVPCSRGVPAGAMADVVVLRWNDIEALKRCFDALGGDIAALIVEPIPFNTLISMPKPGILECARELCTKSGALLIFDELVTGFRVAPGGAQQLFGVTPDLATFGKAIANGVAISAVAGRRDVMERIAEAGMMHAGTHNGNPLGVCAARATLAELRRDDGAVHRQLEHLGGALIEGVRAAAQDAGVPLLVHGVGAMFQSVFAEGPPISDIRDGLARVNTQRSMQLGMAMQARGVRLMRDKWLLSASHSAGDIDAALAAFREALDEIRRS